MPLPLLHNLCFSGTFYPQECSQKREIFAENFTGAPLDIEMQTEASWETFCAFPEYLLPPLPPGHLWIRKHDQYQIIRNSSGKEHDLRIVIYGPAENGQINFIFINNDVSEYSLAFTKKKKDLKLPKHKLAKVNFFSEDHDYRNDDFSHHVVGHMIDHVDTIWSPHRQQTFGSTFDIRNYSPEPPKRAWGLDIRKWAIYELRHSNFGGIYVQLNTFDSTPLETLDGTPIPSYISLMTFSQNANFGVETWKPSPKNLFEIAMDEELTRESKSQKWLDCAKQNYSSTVETYSAVTSYCKKMTDRDLRTASRGAQTIQIKIQAGDLECRFPDKNRLLASKNAAAMEMGSVSKTFIASFLCCKIQREKEAREYMRAGLKNADRLQELSQDFAPALLFDARTQLSAVQKSFDKNVVIYSESTQDHFHRFMNP